MGNPTDTIPIVEYDDFPTESLEDLETLPSHHIGAGAIERAFCPIAHQAAQGSLTYTIHPAETCPHFRFATCGLTDHRSPCLFAEPTGHRHWQLIRQSIALQLEADQ